MAHACRHNRRDFFRGEANAIDLLALHLLCILALMCAVLLIQMCYMTLGQSLAPSLQSIRLHVSALTHMASFVPCITHW